MSKVTENTYIIKGKSGTKHEFNIYTLDTSFRDVGGIYVFTRRTKSNGHFYHSNVYIGKTNDFSSRFENHHKKDCITKFNANCICVIQVDSENKRTEIETDLLLGNNTFCNEINN